MSNYKEIIQLCRPDYIKSITLVREQDQGLLSALVQFWYSGSVIDFTLVGFEGLALAISPMLEADTIIISKELNSGKEFGTIRIECWDDDIYEEFFCDALEKK